MLENFRMHIVKEFKMRIFCFLTEIDWSQESFLATTLWVSFSFFFDVYMYVWCQV